MTHTLQVLYPAHDDTKFDFDYYASEHMKIVGSTIGPHIDKTLIVRGQKGPDGKLGYHAVASIVLADKSKLDAAMDAIGPAVEDIPNFYNGVPQMVIGEVIG